MRELCNLAHPGPWFATIDDADFPVVTVGRANDWLACASCDNPHSADDMAFIAAARSWIPAALERLAELEAYRDAAPHVHAELVRESQRQAPAPRESESER